MKILTANLLLQIEKSLVNREESYRKDRTREVKKGPSPGVVAS